MKFSKTAKELSYTTLFVINFSIISWFWFIPLGIIMTILSLVYIYLLIDEIRHLNPQLDCEHEFKRYNYYFGGGTWAGYDDICIKCKYRGAYHREYF